MRYFHTSRFYGGLVLICAVMLASGFYVSEMPLRQARNGLWVTHTREVIDMLGRLEMHVYQGQLSRTSKVTPVRETPAIDETLDALEMLTEDNLTQQTHIETLRRMIGEKQDQAGFIQLVTQMRQEEEALLTGRKARWEEALRRTQWTIITIEFLMFAMVLAAYIFFSRAVAQRARAVLRSKAEADRLGQILHVQHAIATHGLDIEKVMQLIAEQTQPLTDAEGSIVELIEDGEMVYKAASGLGAPHMGLRIKAKGSLSGLSVEKNEVLICHDAETDSRVDREACRRVGLRAMVVVPLLLRQKPIGVLKVFSSLPHAFDQDDVNALELLAGLLSAKMGDAMRFSAIRETNVTLAGEREELRFSNAQLEELASTDGLTGLKNNRSFRERLSDEFHRAKRYKTDFSLLLIDVDHFKKFNDQFGHVAGDVALRNTAHILKNTARNTDFVARYGGEEFVIILPETGHEGAVLIAERLRAQVADAPWDYRQVTISIGVGCYSALMNDQEELVKSADKALYRAKDGGRNRVALAA